MIDDNYALICDSIEGSSLVVVLEEKVRPAPVAGRTDADFMMWFMFTEFTPVLEQLLVTSSRGHGEVFKYLAVCVWIRQDKKSEHAPKVNFFFPN